MGQKKERFVNGPESEQFNRMKGKKIRLDSPPYGRPLFGTLAWVDVYTMGIRFEERGETAIVYKGPGMIIALA